MLSDEKYCTLLVINNGYVLILYIHKRKEIEEALKIALMMIQDVAFGVSLCMCQSTVAIWQVPVGGFLLMCRPELITVKPIIDTRSGSFI